MRIVIEIDGEKVTAVRDAGDAAASPATDLPEPASAIPPPDLLARAKALGASSAGPASLGVGAAMAASAPAGEPVARAVPNANPRGQTKSRRRSRG